MNELLYKLATMVEDGEEKPKEKDSEEKKKEVKKPENKNGGNPFAKKENGGEEKPNGEGGKGGDKENGMGGEGEGNGDVAGGGDGDEAGGEGGEWSDEEYPWSDEEGGGEGGEGAVPSNDKQHASAPADLGTVIDFIQQAPNPTDEQFTQFSQQHGVDGLQMEQVAFGLATKLVNLLRGGKMAESGIDMASVDQNELQMGIDHGLQTHTSDQSIAKKLALDNLCCIPDYYSRLQKMEQDYLAESSAAAVPDKSKSIVNQEGSTQEAINEEKGEEIEDEDKA